MRHLIISAAVLAMGGSSAQAQSTTTTCNWVGNTVYCNTPQQPYHALAPDWQGSVPDTMGSMKAGTGYANSIYDRMNKVRAQQLRQQVGAMVAAGQCAQARATALNAGNFELAGQVDSFCKR